MAAVTDMTDREMLIEIRGKIDLLNERHSHHTGDIGDIRGKLQLYSTRIYNLEQAESERKGMGKIVTAIWSLGGVFVGMIVAAIPFAIYIARTV